MKLESKVEELKGVGEAVNKKLASLGIFTVNDLIFNYPRKYDDYSNVVEIRRLKPGPVTVRVAIKQATGRYVSRGMHITEAVASDVTGSVRLIWFNQPYRAAGLKHDSEYYVSGEFALRRQRLSIQNPSIEQVENFPVSTARIVPIYKETKGIKSYQIRKLLREAKSLIDLLPESLPEWLVTSEKLMSRHEAVLAMHFPKDNHQLSMAKKRLGFEEVFELTLAALLNKRELLGEHALNIQFDQALAVKFVKCLPFTLTDAQRRVIWQIYKDMELDHPMNRLVEGDVGSGKTVVAVMSALMVMKHGFQVSLMAPTELLARQHAETIHKMLKPLGSSEEVVLLVGGMSATQKRMAHVAITSGKAKLIVGTHALIAEKINMHKLGLIIIDEQHRFGVEQRKKLQAKAGHMPHVLSLTATPIPRSLALTLYGELDISVVDTKPVGRKAIITKIVSPNSRAQLYKIIDKELENGRQMFVVCPLISDSEVLNAESVEKVYDTLRTTSFKRRRVGLLHGRMKSDLKDSVMHQFANGELDILVSTTVIEVGVNVPNATVMLVENAERFGLAQIHQLRGRVGRSDQQGYCYLMLGDSFQPSRRLQALESSDDGFVLAELDLEIRGPGAIYGQMQHGALDLRVAKLTDTRLISAARAAAHTFIDKQEKLVQYKQLQSHVNRLRAVTTLN